MTLRATTDPTYALRGALLKVKVTHRAAIIDELQLGALMRSIDEYDGWPTLRAALQLTPATSRDVPRPVATAVAVENKDETPRQDAATTTAVLYGLPTQTGAVQMFLITSQEDKFAPHRSSDRRPAASDLPRTADFGRDRRHVSKVPNCKIIVRSSIRHLRLQIGRQVPEHGLRNRVSWKRLQYLAKTIYCLIKCAPLQMVRGFPCHRT